MNFYNPYVTNFQTGLTTAPASVFQSNLGFQQNLLAPLYLNSLNQKRTLEAFSGAYLDSDPYGWEPTKKLKLNNELPQFQHFHPTINQAIKNNPLSNQVKNVQKEIPIVDLEDDCLIVGSTSNQQQSMPNNQASNLFNLDLLQLAQSSFANTGPLFQRGPFSQVWNHSTSQNALLGELSGSLNLVQQLSQRDEILSHILNSNNNPIQLLGQEVAKKDLKNQEIIIIDEDDSTCQTTPQSAGEGSLKKIEFNLNPVKQDFVQSLEKLRVNKTTTKTRKETNKKPQETTTTKISQKLSPLLKEETKENLTSLQTESQDESVASNTYIYAVIPPFIAGSGERSRRKPKLKWDPNSESAEVYRKGFDTIQKIVGIEITNESKIIEALKEYDMNLEVAYEKIKRNKASYRNFFRVQRSLRSNSLLR